MRNYEELAGRITLYSHIAALVLLSANATDCEFIGLKPIKLEDAEVISRIAGRGLRSVGVFGAVTGDGIGAACVFREALEPSVLTAIAAAFTEYVRVRTQQDCSEQIGEAVEVEELERLYAL